jgi:autotransporter-associated beta strand protein
MEETIMKNVLTAVLFSIILGGISLAQGQSSTRPNPRVLLDTSKGRIVVLEFEDKANIGAVGIQKLQDGISAAIAGSGKFRVVEREQLNAAARNGNLQITQLTSASVQPTAVKIGKLLGVNYVLTGRVTEYSYDAGGRLAMTVETQLVKVGTGHLILAGTNTYRGTTYINTGALRNTSGSNTWSGPVTLNGSSVIGSPVALEKVMKPVIQQMTASLKAADL